MVIVHQSKNVWFIIPTYSSQATQKLIIMLFLPLQLDYKLCPRREGDVPEIYAVADLAWKEMGWKAEKNINDMCRYLTK